MQPQILPKLIVLLTMDSVSLPKKRKYRNDYNIFDICTGCNIKYLKSDKVLKCKNCGRTTRKRPRTRRKNINDTRRRVA